jgi:phosphoenolpyruvate synthase/pyruvate phosphate dikinase
MIELPRAALRAGEIAATAEFFSFGTNDLTQTAFDISRDDAASFLGRSADMGECHMHAARKEADEPPLWNAVRANIIGVRYSP